MDYQHMKQKSSGYEVIGWRSWRMLASLPHTVTVHGCDSAVVEL